MDDLAPAVRAQQRLAAYLAARPALLAALGHKAQWQLRFLAQGEYSLNYLLESPSARHVCRLVTASQMGMALGAQTSYEYAALGLLAPSGVTPQPFFCDAALAELPHGLIVEQYLPGRPLDYRLDIAGAAVAIAAYHNLPVAPDAPLFRPQQLLEAIYTESLGFIAVFRAAPGQLAPLVPLFDAAFAKALIALPDEAVFQQGNPPVYVNYDLNPYNFVVAAPEGAPGRVSVIDWEKARVSAPAQDLAHFLVITTTLWKQSRAHLLSAHEEEQFLLAYCRARTVVNETLLRRQVDLMRFFIYLRALAWCAMAWVEYQQPGRAIRNPDTFAKIEEYLQEDVLRRVYGLNNL
ncbi:MAG: phosphotransferase [Chloroflexales bacterium]|nr:phosphotransferase [Chloroflexales bacterium]